MIQCTDSGKREAMLYGTTKKHAWEGYVVLLGTLFTILTLREAFWGGKKTHSLCYFQHLLICAGCREEPASSQPAAKRDGQFESRSIRLPPPAALPNYCTPRDQSLHPPPCPPIRPSVRRCQQGAGAEPLPFCMCVMRSFFRASPLMSESLSLKSLSPLPLSLPLNFSASRPEMVLNECPFQMATGGAGSLP